MALNYTFVCITRDITTERQTTLNNKVCMYGTYPANHLLYSTRTVKGLWCKWTLHKTQDSPAPLSSHSATSHWIMPFTLKLLKSRKKDSLNITAQVPSIPKDNFPFRKIWMQWLLSVIYECIVKFFLSVRICWWVCCFLYRLVSSVKSAGPLVKSFHMLLLHTTRITTVRHSHWNQSMLCPALGSEQKRLMGNICKGTHIHCHKAHVFLLCVQHPIHHYHCCVLSIWGVVNTGKLCCQ